MLGFWRSVPGCCWCCVFGFVCFGVLFLFGFVCVCVVGVLCLFGFVCCVWLVCVLCLALPVFAHCHAVGLACLFVASGV